MKNYLLTIPLSILISFSLLALLGVEYTFDSCLMLSFIVNGYIFPFPDELNVYAKKLAQSIVRRIFDIC